MDGRACCMFRMATRTTQPSAWPGRDVGSPIPRGMHSRENTNSQQVSKNVDRKLAGPSLDKPEAARAACDDGVRSGGAGRGVTELSGLSAEVEAEDIRLSEQRPAGLSRPHEAGDEDRVLGREHARTGQLFASVDLWLAPQGLVQGRQAQEGAAELRLQVELNAATKGAHPGGARPGSALPSIVGEEEGERLLAR